MPIDDGFTSRRTLVQKMNPNHGPDGRFATGGGGRRGGTVGAPTEDALGNPLRPRRNKGGAGTYPATQAAIDGKQTVAAHNQRLQQAASHVHGTPDGGTSGGHVPLTRRLYEAGAIKLTPQEKQFHQIEQVGPKFTGFTKEQMARNYQIMHGKPPELNTLGQPKKLAQPKKRSSFS